MSLLTGPSTEHPVFARLPLPVQVPARDLLARYRHRGLRAVDLLLAVYPKSGSTWLSFLIASALTARDVDFDLVRELAPGLGRQRVAPSLLPGGGRLVMSHDRPRSFVPGERPQVLCLVRDGRDVAVSYFHHLRRRGIDTGDFSSFVDLFLAGRVSPYGTWHNHVRRWQESAKRSSTVLILRYEDLLTDPLTSLTEVVKVFDLPVGEDALRAAIEAAAPGAMREKESTSRRISNSTVDKSVSFVRSATAGQWRDSFDAASLARFETVAGRELSELGYELVEVNPAQ